ncbi:MAG: hypothetical protein IJ702_00785 [Fretibacterium sp.]|nr:hypothetical protein [Fretibacterium sp.]
MAEAAGGGAEYVRKDVFEISMQRLEALMERNLARQEAIAGEMKADIEKLRREVKEEVGGLRSEMKEEIGGLRTETKGEIGSLRGEIDGLRSEMKGEVDGLRAEIKMVDERVNSVNARIDSVQTTVYWGFAIMGLILAFTPFAPALLEFVKGLRRPSFTLTDVERMINAAINQARVENR